MKTDLVSLDNSSGIYMVLNVMNGKFYIGHSRYLKVRFRKHLTDFAKGGNSRILQQEFDFYGDEAFQFHVLEETVPELLVEREQYWMDTANPAYNLHPNANSPVGYKHTEDTRKKDSQHMRGKQLFLGRKHSEETKRKMSDSMKGNTNGSGNGKHSGL